MQYGNFWGRSMRNLPWRLIWQTPATRRRAQTWLCRSTAKQGIQPSGPMNFGHIHSQGLRYVTVCVCKKAAQPPASATRLSCSPRTIPSRARTDPAGHGSNCVYAFTAGGHARGRQSNFRVKMLQAVLRGGRASCFHRYAAARRASMLFKPCPVQPATKTSQCPAGSGMPLPRQKQNPRS